MFKVETPFDEYWDGDIVSNTISRGSSLTDFINYNIFENCINNRDVRCGDFLNSILKNLYNDDRPYDKLVMEYENVKRNKKSSDYFLFTYTLDNICCNTLLSISDKIYLIHIDDSFDVFPQRTELIPWIYPKDINFMGFANSYCKEEIIYDFSHRSYYYLYLKYALGESLNSTTFKNSFDLLKSCLTYSSHDNTVTFKENGFSIPLKNNSKSKAYRDILTLPRDEFDEKYKL